VIDAVNFTIANSSDGYNNDTINRRDRAEFCSMRRDSVIGGAVGGRWGAGIGAAWARPERQAEDRSRYRTDMPLIEQIDRRGSTMRVPLNWASHLNHSIN
jgi:hypothetical protein